MASALESCLVRIYGRDGAVVGAGFLVAEKHVVTCAHVVLRALGLPDDYAGRPEGTVETRCLSPSFQAPSIHRVFTAFKLGDRHLENYRKLGDRHLVFSLNSPP